MLPDNLELFERHDAEQEEMLEALPICDRCGEFIQDVYCYEINREVVCHECMVDLIRRHTTDFMG